MYGVYIVDDESIVVEDLITSIPWLENGFEVIGFNINPKTALAEIIDLQPDAVFCDLKMPGCGGIELMRQIRENGVDTEFIMLSAYGEFEASRSFFLMDGFDYILKPLDQYSAGLVLEKISRKLAAKNNWKPSVQFVPSQSVHFDDLVAYITANFNKRHSLKSLSGLFHLSPTYICDLFAKNYESTLTIFITSIRMREAGRLILEKDVPLKEISSFCGYPNYYHFCKVFRAHYGMAPSSYRDSVERATDE
jgi:YesN/AraC family two-component response regulator